MDETSMCIKNGALLPNAQSAVTLVSWCGLLGCEDGGSMVLWNIGTLLHHYITTQHHNPKDHNL